MSLVRKSVVAAGLMLALGSAAYASDAPETWTLKADTAYIVDMQGHTMAVNLRSPSAAMMARAQEVPHGTLFFMHDGKLMMVYDPTMNIFLSR